MLESLNGFRLVEKHFCLLQNYNHKFFKKLQDLPGQVFLLHAIDAISNTFSIREPSKSLYRKSTKIKWLSVPSKEYIN